MQPLLDVLSALGLAHPVTFIVCFLAASLAIVWRTEALLDRGLEGTALGTLLLPYCSGLGNMTFVFLLLRDNGPPGEIVVNSVVNNITNLTVLLAVPALAWGLVVVPGAKSAGRRGASTARPRAKGGAVLEQRIGRLSLLLTLTAAAFFLGAVWVLGHDGTLSRSDGWALIGLFLFWQCFQVFDTLKHNLRRRVELGPAFALDLLVLLSSGWIVYESLDWLVEWLTRSRSGFFRAEHLGWITGWLLVLPNALVAFFYAARRRADVVYSSQIGDGHICIPLCIGLFAAVRPLPLPPLFAEALPFLLGALGVHALCLALLGRLPRAIAGLLLLGYAWFTTAGLSADG